MAFRRSCREGICGSCAMNINGKNGLACITPIENGNGFTVSHILVDETTVRPLPQLFVLKDLIPDMTNFYQHYQSIRPWLQRDDENTEESSSKETYQSIEDRKKLDGLYEVLVARITLLSVYFVRLLHDLLSFTMVASRDLSWSPSFAFSQSLGGRFSRSEYRQTTGRS